MAFEIVWRNPIPPAKAEAHALRVEQRIKTICGVKDLAGAPQVKG